MSAQPELRFDGETFDPALDAKRLSGHWRRVFDVMSDGQWRTLAEIAEAADVPATTVGSRVRDLRKKRFGDHSVEPQRPEVGGSWRYRLVVNRSALNLGS